MDKLTLYIFCSLVVTRKKQTSRAPATIVSEVPGRDDCEPEVPGKQQEDLIEPGLAAGNLGKDLATVPQACRPIATVASEPNDQVEHAINASEVPGKTHAEDELPACEPEVQRQAAPEVPGNVEVLGFQEFILSLQETNNNILRQNTNILGEIRDELRTLNHNLAIMAQCALNKEKK